MHDDPIAQLRALDPADEKELDVLVAGLPGVGPLLSAKPPRRRRRSRFALLAAAGAVTAAVLVALVANPFAGSGTISSAEAKAQVAEALDLEGGWHVSRILQDSSGERGSGSATPQWSKPLTEDVWHAPDGRLVITSTNGEGQSSTWLYAGGERRSYDAYDNTLTIHRFVLQADLRDEMSRYLPASATDLYRAAHRVGKVRLAGIETVGGRRVYRLAFDWLGSSYTLVFDADRKVPISSQTKTPSGAAAGAPKRYFYTRVRYAAYRRVQAGEALDRRLVLPAVPNNAKIVQERPIVVPTPVRGASARQLALAVAARYKSTFAPASQLARATYSIVRPIPGGGLVALVRIPTGNRTQFCTIGAEIAHPGGEARPGIAGCWSRGGGYASSASQNGKVLILSGRVPDARALAFEFAGGRVVRAEMRDGTFLATPARALFEKPAKLVVTKHDGTVVRRPWPFHSFGVDFATRLTG